MSERAAALVGDEEEFLFLAGDEIEVAAPAGTVWGLLEGDHQRALLAALSSRFLGREVLAELPDGYRCRTTARVRFGRRRSFDSVVWVDEPERSVELQVGDRTELRYTTTYEPSPAGTRLRCEQAYRARRSTFDSGAAIGAMQRRATEVVAARLAAALVVLEGS